MNKLIVKLIVQYQHSTSNVTPTCRYSPTCSEYAKQAFQQKNLVVASGLSVWRILRCNPLFKGGYDPLPGTHKE